MRLAVIPARGGSKRIPRKNIKEFGGKPIVAWSIEAAKQSGCFDEVIVSTDDLEIAMVAKNFGANVPFLRPPSLSDDYTGTTAVVRHAIDWFRQNGIVSSEGCCIYATAPFIQVEDLRRGLDLLLEKDCRYTFSVTSYPFPIQRAIRMVENGRVEMLHPELFNTRSQDLEEFWHDAGQFYWGRNEAWMAQEMIFATDSVPVVLQRHRVQDIDTPEDWKRAELMLKIMQQ